MISFTQNQGKVIASGLTVLSLALVFAFTSFVVWVLFKALSFTAPALIPVILGFFLSLFFKPYYGWWKKWLRNPTLALLVMLATVFIPVGLICWYAGSVLIEQVTNLIAQGPELVKQVYAWFSATFPNLHQFLMKIGNPVDGVGDFYTKYAVAAFQAGLGAFQCLSVVVSVLVTMIFFVFFLTTKDRKSSEIVEQFAFLKDSTRAFVAEQIDIFTEIIVSFFQRQVVICLIEGVLYGSGFALVGLPYGFLIGFALGLLNLIPLFGSLVCLPVALPLAYFVHGGSLTRLIAVLSVWLIGQVLDGYFITPRIQGNRTGLGYAGVIFSFFFWGVVLGPMLGMLLAIPLSAFCVVLWRAVKQKYIRPVM